MRNRQHSVFTTVTSEGALLPVDVLQRIAQFDATLTGLSADDYHHDGEKLNEVINESWLQVLRAWKIFQAALARLPESDAGTTLTRERWLLPLFSELGYGRLVSVKAQEIGGKSYPISHGWQHTPIHLVSYKIGLDQLNRSSTGGYRHSPYSLVQEMLNRSADHLWGMVSNGLSLRLLRKNVSLTRQAYIEFDLEAMMQGESYADFVLLWLLCHQSRVEAERPGDCWLEKWSRLAQEQGVRALNQLREGVEAAINALGRGFLSHPANHELKQKLRDGTLKSQDYYRQVLRFVYRLIILFVTEDRDVLFHPQADETARARYIAYFSTAHLRHLAQQRVGTRHSDLFHALRLVMDKLGSDEGCPVLGLPALNGFLFSQDAMPDLAGCQLANYELLDAVRSLAFTYDGHIRRIVDYKNLGAEELGSVYESLLELHPDLNVDAATFVLKSAGGNERKTSGSYYTPTSLIDCLLDSALEPVLAEAYKQADPEHAILDLKVCDPACGSGHFLIAAAHRIARRLASVRTGSEEPDATSRRAALRDVVGHCIYGVDINPMAVELCKVNLWLEAIEPGKPLSFLDAHIQCGNSLLGTTPALLRGGIPDSAFEPIEGDDKKICSEYKKKNKAQRAGGQLSLFTEDLQPWDRLGDLAAGMLQLEEMGDDTVEEIHRKQEQYARLISSTGYENGKLLADAWCAAFVWKKTKDFAYPITEEVFRRLERNPFTLADWMKDEIQRLAAQYQFFHWHLAFPKVFRLLTKGETPENELTGWSGGFDVVLGNPPWEHTELKEQEWFAARAPAIANAVGVERKRMISILTATNPGLYEHFLGAKRQEDGWSHFTRDSERYPLCGRGRINTYAIFAEDMHQIISKKGYIGCIVPSGIATDDTTKFFFRDLIESRSLVSLFSFENEAKLFPGIDHRIKFALLTASDRAKQKNEAEFAFGIYRTTDLQDKDRHFSLSASDIALLNPNTRTCPIFRSKRDAELTKAIYQRLPIFVKDEPSANNPWNASFRQGIFNMTSASHLFRSRKQLEQDGWQLKGNIFAKDEEQCLPLYEGKMVWHFDHRFGTYDGQTQAQANQGKLPELDEQQHQDPFLSSIPQYWVHESHLPELMKDGRQVLLVFRDITNASVLRTSVFSILPVVPCGHKLPIVVLEDGRTRDTAYLLTCFSSFIFDYMARQKLGGTSLSYFILKQLPILTPDQYKMKCLWDNQLSLSNWILPRALELTYTAWDLEPFAKDCGYAGPPFRWDTERRFLLRCELDAAYFHLYGIARDDVDYIMDTFRVWKEKEEKQYGEYRTKHMILEIYDELQRAIETGIPYQTHVDPPPADPAVAHPLRTSVEV